MAGVIDLLPLTFFFSSFFSSNFRFISPSSLILCSVVRNLRFSWSRICFSVLVFLADMITLVLAVRDNDGDLVGVLTGVLGVWDFGDCMTILLGCTSVALLAIPLATLLLLLVMVSNTNDLGGVGLIDGLVGNFAIDFWAFPGLFLFSFFDDSFSDLLEGLDVFL